MKRFILIWIMLYFPNANALQRVVIYEAPFGVKVGEYKKESAETNWEEENFVPDDFYVFKNKLIVNDKYQARWQIVDIKSKKVTRVIKNGVPLDYADLDDSVCIYKGGIYKITSNNQLSQAEIYQNDRTYGNYLNIEYVLRHYNTDLKFIKAQGFYILDSLYAAFVKKDLPVDIQYIRVKEHSAWFFRDHRAIIGGYPSALEYLIELKYEELSGRPIDTADSKVYSFPDSIESGRYFDKGFARNFANHDSNYNIYYYSEECDSFRIHDSTFNVMAYQTGNSRNPFERKTTHYREDIAIISSYDRLGQLRFWFPEPPIGEGWKKALAPIFVSDEGRIFRMIFYSHDNKTKEQIDNAKGIKIIEYIPEKKEFSHEQRVKMYGNP
ncbi:MAG: hypothetical protein GF344_06190 [Chitinivibrionales bacterium]|nr:hypothetical protein [Chitinivibrionales bacterium]